MAEPERFTVKEHEEYGLRLSDGREVTEPPGDHRPWSTRDRWVAERLATTDAVMVKRGATVVSRRVFVMTGEWQPVAPKVGLPEPLSCGSMGKYGFGPCVRPPHGDDAWHRQEDGKRWDDGGRVPTP